MAPINDLFRWRAFVMLVGALAYLPLGLASAIVSARAVVTSQPTVTSPAPGQIQARQTTSAPAGPPTCGYDQGDPAQARIAPSGSDCRYYTSQGLWGFCATTITDVTNCGLAGACMDSYSCSKTTGCRFFIGIATVTTTTCATSQYCSTVLLSDGAQTGTLETTWAYLACGNTATTDHYLVTTTTPSTSSTSVVATPSSSTSTIPSPMSNTTSIPVSTPTAAKSTNSSPPPASSTGTTALTPSSSSQNPITSTTSSTSPTQTANSTLTGAATVEDTNSQATSTKTGAILGGTLGGVAVCCGVALLTIYCLRRRLGRGNGMKHPPLYLPPEPSSSKPSFSPQTSSTLSPKAAAHYFPARPPSLVFPSWSPGSVGAPRRPPRPPSLGLALIGRRGADFRRLPDGPVPPMPVPVPARVPAPPPAARVPAPAPTAVPEPIPSIMPSPIMRARSPGRSPPLKNAPAPLYTECAIELPRYAISPVEMEVHGRAPRKMEYEGSPAELPVHGKTPWRGNMVYEIRGRLFEI